MSDTEPSLFHSLRKRDAFSLPNCTVPRTACGEIDRSREKQTPSITPWIASIPFKISALLPGLCAETSPSGLFCAPVSGVENPVPNSPIAKRLRDAHIGDE